MSYNTFTPIVTDSLVLYLDAANTKSYPGTGTSWLDLSKNNNNGTLTNGPTYNSSNSGNIIFDGVDDYVGVGNNDSLKITGPLSIIVWVNPTDFSVFNGIIGKTGIGGSNTNQPAPYDYYLNQTTGIPSFLRGNGNSGSFGTDVNFSIGTSSPIVGVWNFLAVTMTNSGNNGLVTHYLNGNMNGSGSLIYTNPCADGGNNARVGSRTDGVTRFKGGIANIMIYNRALSQIEVLQNYNATKFRYL